MTFLRYHSKVCNMLSTNIPWKKMKANSICSTICFTSKKEKKKKAGERGELRTGQAHGSASGMRSHPSCVSWGADTVLGLQRQGVLGTQGPLSPPPTQSHQPHHTHSHTHKQTNFIQHKWQAQPWLYSCNTCSHTKATEKSQ